MYSSWYPELKRFHSADDAAHALKKSHSPWIGFPVFIAGAIIGVIAKFFIGGYFGSWGPDIVLYLCFWGGMFASQFVGVGRTRRKLRIELVSQQVPICIPCGYDLRGQTEPRCPECGASFDSALLSHGPEGDETSEPKKVDDQREAETMSD
jgi:hypothetical protein